MPYFKPGQPYDSAQRHALQLADTVASSTADTLLATARSAFDAKLVKPGMRQTMADMERINNILDNTVVGLTTAAYLLLHTMSDADAQALRDKHRLGPALKFLP